MKSSRFALAALLSLALAPAFAQDNGVYVSVSGVASGATLTSPEAGTLGKRASGYDLTLGGVIGQNVAFEATWADFGSRPLTVAGVGSGEMSARGYGLHFVFSQPVIVPGLTAFVRAGFMHTEIDSGSKTFGAKVPSVGIGAEYRVNPDLSVGVSYGRLNRFARATPALDLDYTRVSLKYHF